MQVRADSVEESLMLQSFWKNNFNFPGRKKIDYFNYTTVDI